MQRRVHQRISIQVVSFNCFRTNQINFLGFECKFLFQRSKSTLRFSVALWFRNLAIHIQAIPGNDQNASPTNQKTAGSKLERTS